MSDRRLHWPEHPRRPEPPEELTGKTIAGRFRLDERLTYTALSSLYRGHDRHGRASVAVKIMRPELDAGEEERFRREGRILANIRHPNIAEFIDCGVTEDGLCYLVTALVDGRSLGQLCRESAIPLRDVWQIGAQVADALACAHARGVIHRDVKPSNVLWSATKIAKLIDFGIAKVEARAEFEVTPPRHPTAIGIPIGTPGYLPPEAAEQVGPRTDVFGLGRTLYRLLTRREAKEAPVGLESVPEVLRQVVLQAIKPDPEARIESAAEFRRRWLAAGAELWPSASDPVLRAAPQIWPPPADTQCAPSPATWSSASEAGEVCTTSTPPRLFARRLELRTRLGGTHCQTWRAYHHLLDREVVVKIVPRALNGTFVVGALCREAAALDKLSHRAFPRVLECDIAEDGSWYMVQEYIDGESLSETFKRAPIDPLAALEIVIELAEALHEAHTRGILHGDIKGNNVIIARCLPPRARLIDLSECQLQETFFATTEQRYARTPLHRLDDGVTRGYPWFAAPEILSGAKKSPATEVYALGVVLYILLTGERQGAAAIRQIFTSGPRAEAGDRLRARLVACAAELEDTFIASDFQDILAPEPEQRTATMADLLELLRNERDALRELRAPRAVSPKPAAAAPPNRSTTPPGLTRPALTPALSRWTAVACLAGLLAAIVLWLSFRTERPLDPPPMVTPEPIGSPTPSPEKDPPPTSVDAPAIPVRLASASTPSSSPTRTQVEAALTARTSELSRCPSVPSRLTLTIDIAAHVTLAEIQHAPIESSEPLDRCLVSIVESLALRSDPAARHVVGLELGSSGVPSR